MSKLSDEHMQLCIAARFNHSLTPINIQVVAELDETEQALLLKFVTSCSRPPLGGFQYLHPPLCCLQLFFPFVCVCVCLCVCVCACACVLLAVIPPFACI